MSSLNYKLLKNGNSKLGNNIATWSIPPKMSCKTICKGCYANKGHYHSPKVKMGLQRRFEFSQDSSFVETMTNEIRSSTAEYIRLHTAGDFYSQEYVDKWVEIVNQNPQKTFYVYTKRKNDFDFSVLEALPNITVIDSLKFGTLNYGKKEHIDKLGETTGAIVCQYGQGSDSCGTSCIKCMTKEAEQRGVLFYQH